MIGALEHLREEHRLIERVLAALDRATELLLAEDITLVSSGD